MSQRSDKPLPVIPQPSIVITSSNGAQYGEQGETMTGEDEALPFAGMHSRSATPDITRREYALLEFLRSERTYVSDLVLLRDYQIPLAAGRLSSISSMWPGVDATICQYRGVGRPAVSNADVDLGIPQGPSSRGSRPLTTASNVSAMSFGSIFTLRPMKTKDVNIVFSNIEELAAFSEEFLHQLESALGQLIEGNEGEDFVGRLFLDSLPQMERLYETYIMNQPHALEHYHRLSQTFQFDVYFPRSQILAHKSSNAWDLPSLLIKPVQRLLHYPQLLATVLAQTPDTHHDKAALIEAHARMTDTARGLNERWRQRSRQLQVVREVLVRAGLVDPTPESDGAPRTRKKSGLRVSLPGSMSLGRIVVPWQPADRAKDQGLVLSEMDPVTQTIKAGGETLKQYEAFMAAFMAETTSWADAMRDLVSSFDELAQGFLRVMRIDHDDLRGVVALVHLMDITSDLWRLVDSTLKVDVYEEVARTTQCLKNSIAAPKCLVEKMERLEPLHYELLNLNVVKSRPPSSLLEASRSFVALRGQLFEELPRYLTLLQRGMAGCILRFARIQGEFYSNVRNIWREFWDSIKVDGQTNKGAVETLQIWWKRFSEAEGQLSSLNILRSPLEEQASCQHRKETSSSQLTVDGGVGTLTGTVPFVRLGAFAPRLDGQPETIPDIYPPTPSAISLAIPSKSASTVSLVVADSPGNRQSPDSLPDIEPHSLYYYFSPPTPLFINVDPSDSDLSANYFFLRHSRPSENPRSSSRTTVAFQDEDAIRIPALYRCRVVRPYRPPHGATYRDIPFFTLTEGQVYEILAETGNPSMHSELPFQVDDREGCLLLVRSLARGFGWAFATYMCPVDERPNLARPVPSSEP